MNSLKEFLRGSIPADPHLWIALVAAAIIMLMELLHRFEWLQVEVVLSVIMLCILMLAWERLKERNQVRENAKTLDSIAHSVFDKRMALRTRPLAQDEYDYLWGGYTGNYYVYNPAYKVDENIGEKRIVDILTRRYQDPLFVQAQYLFLTGDVAGQNELQTFRRLMTGVRGKYPEVINKIQVKQMKSKAATSAPEMYLGERRGDRVGVLELKGPTLDQQHGTSHYYLLINDDEVIKHYLFDHFQQAWEDATCVKVDDLWP